MSAHEARVKFCEEDKNQVFPVLRRLSNITNSERELVWFDEEEYDTMKLDCMKTVHKIEKGKVLKDKKYTTTGVECFTTQGQEERYYWKNLAWDVVFEEQYLKKQQERERDMMGIVSSSGRGKQRRSSAEMSLAYHNVAQYAAERAIQTASCIHQDVEQYLLK